MIYFLYYLLCVGTLVFENKFRIIIFSIIWFIFVGLRSGIGVDWYATSDMFERAIIPFEDYFSAFQGYQFFDSEIAYKLISTLLIFINGDTSYVFILIALIEAFFISIILFNIPNSRIGILVILFIFSIHYPMNAVRQGLCLISLCLYVILKDRYIKKIGLILALISHWASIPLVLIIASNEFVHKYKKSILFLLFLLFFIIAFSYYEILLLRFNISDTQYLSNGYGIKYLFSYLSGLAIINLNKNLNNYKNKLLLLILYVGVLLYPPFMRYFYFFTYFLAIVSLVNLNKISKVSVITLGYSFFMMIFEWQEVFRFQDCYNCGRWFPYINLIFD